MSISSGKEIFRTRPMSNRGLAIIDKGKCTGCGQCVATCSRGAISMMEGIATIDTSLCRGCGACAELCPSGAISMVLPSREMVAVESRPAFPATQAADRVAMPVNVPKSPGFPSLLARAAAVVAPAVLNLAVAVGQAWLDRITDGSSSGTISPNRPAGARRRMRRRGR